MVAIKKRAVSPEQKAFRREQILAAAADMFSEMRYEDVNMTVLARTVGITKPALYRYFRGKEVLFLALFVQELEKLRGSFDTLSQQEKLGAYVAGVFVGHPLYCRLSAILHTVLERDLTYDEALSFKQTLQEKVGEIGQRLAVALGTADSGLVFEKMMLIQHALIGVWHMTHPVGAVKEVLERDDMALFNQDFETALSIHLTTILGK